MQFKIALVALFASVAIAVPTGGHKPGDKPGNGGGSDGGSDAAAYDPCSGLYDSPQCCATDVLGVANLDCGSPSSVPTSAADFRSVCAAKGQRARCCVLPVLGLAVLCQTPVGV